VLGPGSITPVTTITWGATDSQPRAIVVTIPNPGRKSGRGFWPHLHRNDQHKECSHRYRKSGQAVGTPLSTTLRYFAAGPSL